MKGSKLGRCVGHRPHRHLREARTDSRATEGNIYMATHTLFAKLRQIRNTTMGPTIITDCVYIHVHI